MNDPLEAILTRAARAFKREQPMESLHLLNQAIAEFPHDPRAWEMRGGVYVAMGNSCQAFEDLQKAYVIGGLSATPRLMLIDCSRRLGRREEAIELAQDMAWDDKLDVKHRSKLASILGSLGENSTALAVCEDILAAEKDSHPAWFGVGYYRARLGFRASQILPFVIEASRLDPDNTLYGVNLALLDGSMGRRDAARDRLLEIDPESVRCPCLLEAIAHSHILRAHGVCENARLQRLKEWLYRLASIPSCPPGARCCVTLPGEAEQLGDDP